MNKFIGVLQLVLAYRMITDEDLPPQYLSDKSRTYDFEQFSCLISELRHKRKRGWRKTFSGMMRWPWRVVGESLQTFS
jgi:hypothetical protein